MATNKTMKKLKAGETVIIISGKRSKAVGTLVRYEWVNVLGKDMWLVSFDDNFPDGYFDETQLKAL